MLHLHCSYLFDHFDAHHAIWSRALFLGTHAGMHAFLCWCSVLLARLSFFSDLENKCCPFGVGQNSYNLCSYECVNKSIIAERLQKFTTHIM